MIRRLLRRFTGDEHGFTMVTVLGAMLVLGTFSAAAWSAANGDIPGARKDQDRKSAYEAAEAGVQWYMHQLEQSTNFWSTCTPTTAGVNMRGSRTSRRTVSGTTSADREQFAIEVMTPDGVTCDPDNTDTSLLRDGVLRIRSTGTYRSSTRQIVASFRRDGFLDYVWYTVRETSPPASYNGSNTTPLWVQQHCDDVRANRPNGNNDDQCSTIDFIQGDYIQGPMHTEDDSFMYTGNGPVFGREGGSDKIEISGAGTTKLTAFKKDGSGSYTVNGNVIAPGNTVKPPSTNSALRNYATVILKGNSCIRFNSNDTITTWDNVSNWGGGSNPLPCLTSDQGSETNPLADGTVIWIDNSGTCSGGYQKYQKYVADQCGDVAVWGTYDRNVTIGSSNDIILASNLTRPANSDALMGLVANQFVRIYHPIAYGGATTCNASSSNLGLSLARPQKITAAILATQGSFLADNWGCGGSLGSLNVTGTIAQYWRGAVGTSSNGVNGTGYAKNYIYDNRLKYREPPQFLDPGTSQWHILRETEQVPVATG